MATVFNGEVRSGDAQPIFTPPSNSSPVVLRYYVADGSVVKAGDVLLRIDAGESAVQIRTLDAQIEQAAVKTAKEVAELQLKAVDAELAQVDAQAALDTAKVDAAIPKTLISALDFDRYRAEFERSEHDAVLKQQQLDDAQNAVTRRGNDGKLELEKLKSQRAFHQAEVDSAEVRAERGGTVVHGFNNFFGGNGRCDEGSSSFPGQKVGEVVGAGAMSVRAWVLEPDRAGLVVGEKLRLDFDALPQRVASGTITAISGASEARTEWGSGRYFVVDIDLADVGALPLKPGMSVRVATLQPDDGKKIMTSTNALNANDPVRASGEIYARNTAAITPPRSMICGS